MSNIKTGAQLHEETMTRDAYVKAIAQQIQLKKWCVEQAVSVLQEAETMTESAVDGIAARIYAFMIKE